MSPLIVSFFASCTVSLFFIVLFAIEAKRGTRFFQGARDRFDIFLSSLSVSAQGRVRHFLQLFVPSILRFIWHTCLRFLLSQVTRFEERLRAMMRQNKERVREHGRTKESLTMLDAVSIHKAKITRTPEEKRAELTRMLHE